MTACWCGNEKPGPQSCFYCDACLSLSHFLPRTDAVYMTDSTKGLGAYKYLFGVPGKPTLFHIRVERPSGAGVWVTARNMQPYRGELWRWDRATGQVFPPSICTTVDPSPNCCHGGR